MTTTIKAPRRYCEVSPFIHDDLPLGIPCGKCGCLPERADGSISHSASDTHTRSQSSAITSQSRDPRSSSRERVVSTQPDVDLTQIPDTPESQRTTSASTPQKGVAVKYEPNLRGSGTSDASIAEYFRQQSVNKTREKDRQLPHAGASALTAQPHFSAPAPLPSRSLPHLTGPGPSGVRREFYHFIIDVQVYWYDPKEDCDPKEYVKVKQFQASESLSFLRWYLLIRPTVESKVMLAQRPLKKDHEMSDFIEELFRKEPKWIALAKKNHCTGQWIAQKSQVLNGKPKATMLPTSAFESGDIAGVYANLMRKGKGMNVPAKAVLILEAPMEEVKEEEEEEKERQHMVVHRKRKPKTPSKQSSKIKKEQTIKI